MGSNLKINVFYGWFLKNTSHIVALYILPHMGSSPYASFQSDDASAKWSEFGVHQRLYGAPVNNNH